MLFKDHIATGDGTRQNLHSTARKRYRDTEDIAVKQEEEEKDANHHSSPYSPIYRAPSRAAENDQFDSDKFPWFLVIKKLICDKDQLFTLQKKTKILRTLSLLNKKTYDDVSAFGWKEMSYDINDKCRMIRHYAPMMCSGDFSMTTDNMIMQFYKMFFEENPAEESMCVKRSKFVRKMQEEHENKRFLLWIRLKLILDRDRVIQIGTAMDEYLLKRRELYHGIQKKKGGIVFVDVLDACHDKYGSMQCLQYFRQTVHERITRLRTARFERESRYTEIITLCSTTYKYMSVDLAEKIRHVSIEAGRAVAPGEQLDPVPDIVRIFERDQLWNGSIAYEYIVTCTPDDATTMIRKYAFTGKARFKDEFLAVIEVWKTGTVDRFNEVINSSSYSRMGWRDWSQYVMRYAMKASLEARDEIMRRDLQ